MFFGDFLLEDVKLRDESAQNFDFAGGSELLGDSGDADGFVEELVISGTVKHVT